MLVLTRGISESITIAENVTVKILGINYKGKIMLGIDAPRDVAVDRTEIHLLKMQDKLRLSSPNYFDEIGNI